MSQADVELIKRTYAGVQDAYRSGDLDGLRRLGEEVCAPEFVLKTSGMFAEIGEWHGPTGFVEFVSGQMEAFSEMWIEMDGVLDGEGVAVAWHRFGGRARHTDIEVEFSAALAAWTRDGRVVRTELFTHRNEALAATALGE